jgi:hypothetical protein
MRNRLLGLSNAQDQKRAKISALPDRFAPVFCILMLDVLDVSIDHIPCQKEQVHPLI